ncbi:MAG TPA: R3H domain-containing nucleic acid-binding protein [Terriglobia bacterium]|nr:R3H domain-containing nucleic acid-binding protein [Terriglobia bacterium]
MAVLDAEALRPRLAQFLEKLLRAGRFQLQFEITAASGGGPELLVDFRGPDADLLLARGGEMLAALEHLAAKSLRLAAEEQSLLSFDCQGYKSLREEELRLIAATAAERVRRTRSPFALNPMNARERRIIHLALRDDATVRTESEGSGPSRKVVIHPKP